jgi:hypothetical protein
MRLAKGENRNGIDLQRREWKWNETYTGESRNGMRLAQERIEMV